MSIRKNFRVNTGVRTFDAVSHLRRCGADPEVVHYLFRTDYETNLAECTAIANSVFYPEGLVVAVCPDNANSIQAISGKIADDLLGIENVRVSIVFFRLKDNVIGVSARSTGENQCPSHHGTIWWWRSSECGWLPSEK